MGKVCYSKQAMMAFRHIHLRRLGNVAEAQPGTSKAGGREGGRGEGEVGFDGMSG